MIKCDCFPRLLITACALVGSFEATAQSATIYQYDAAGRVTAVQAGNGIKSGYADDHASNRTNVTEQNLLQTAFEAETLYHQTGAANADGWAVDVNSPIGFMVYGPYTTAVPVGPHVAAWKIMIDNNTADDNQLMFIDVTDGTTQEVLATRVLSRRD